MEMKTRDIPALEAMCSQLRQDVIAMVSKAGSGHPGGSLSAAEYVTALYFDSLENIDPKNPRKYDRDRFVLSKGHCCPILYSALARKGYFDVSNLTKLREYGSILQGHPDMNKTPGVDISSGSLGNGLAVGVGMALSARMKKLNYRVYVMMGDGELQEGMVWEAAMCAAHHKVKNIIAIVDCNNLQINGTIDEIMSVEPLPDKWRAFGWKVIHVADGNDMEQVLASLDQAKNTEGPVVILAKTVKGKGVSFMENVAAWHGQAPNAKQEEQALAELKMGGGQ
nr:transketolase [Clostridium merdae]